MEELVNFMERVPKPQSATCWKNKELQRFLNYIVTMKCLALCFISKRLSLDGKDAARAAEGCIGCVDVEKIVQHAGGQLSSQQSAARGLLTESGRTAVFSPAHTHD